MSSDIYIDRKSVTDPQEGSPDVVAFGRPVLSYTHFDPSKKLVCPPAPPDKPWMPSGVIYHKHGWVLYVSPGVLKQCPDAEGLSPELTAMVHDDWAARGGVDYEDWEHWTEVLDAAAVDEAHRVALAWLGKYSKPSTLRSVPQ